MASPPWDNSDESGSRWLICDEELSSEYSIGWSQRQRTARNVVQKVATGKEVGGGQRLEEGESLDLVRAKIPKFE